MWAFEDKEIKQPSITHACGHLKKRRPPSIPSVHICTKQSSPCLHFGHGSLRLSYCRRGVSLVNSHLLWRKLKHWFRKGIRSKGPLPYYGVSLFSPFFFPKTVVILSARSTSRHWVYNELWCLSGAGSSQACEYL